MIRTRIPLYLAGILYLTDCANTTANQIDLVTAFNAAAAVEASYAASPGSNPTTVRQAAALLSSAQAALMAWQNAATGDSTTEVALSAAIAALVAFEATMK